MTAVLDTSSLVDDGMKSAPCDVCGEMLGPYPVKGGGNFGWRMAMHKKNKHGVAGAGKKRPKKGAPTAEDHLAHPVTSVIREIASEVSGTGTPSADALAGALGRGLSLVTFGGAVIAVESDQVVPQADKQQVIEYLTLAEDDAKALLRPIGKMLAPTRLNQKYGRAVVENVDVIGALAGLAQFGYHWTEYLRLRRQGNALLAQRNAQQQAAGMNGPALAVVPDLQSENVPSGVPNVETHPSGLTHTPGPTQGYVVSAADVARMRAEQGS